MHPPAASVALRSSGRQIAETWRRIPENRGACKGVRSCPVTRDRQESLTIIIAIVTPREPNHKVSPTSSTLSYFKDYYVTQGDLLQDNLWATCYKGHFIHGSISLKEYLTGSLLCTDWLSDSTGCDFICWPHTLMMQSFCEESDSHVVQLVPGEWRTSASSFMIWHVIVKENPCLRLVTNDVNQVTWRQWIIWKRSFGIACRKCLWSFHFLFSLYFCSARSLLETL